MKTKIVYTVETTDDKELLQLTSEIETITGLVPTELIKEENDNDNQEEK